MKIIKWSLIFLAVFIFIFAVVWSSVEIFYPSYLSVQSACGVISEEELEDNGLIIGGSAFFNITEDGEEEITLQVFTSLDSTYRHEFCHVIQNRQGRLFSCEHKFLKFFNEVECYTLQRFPIWNDEIEILKNMVNENGT